MRDLHGRLEGLVWEWSSSSTRAARCSWCIGPSRKRIREIGASAISCSRRTSRKQPQRVAERLRERPVGTAEGTLY